MRELGNVVMSLNPKENGGEQVFITVKYYDNGDGENGIYTTGEITLNSYCNSATITCSGGISSSMLRELANELDKKLIEVKMNLQKENENE